MIDPKTSLAYAVLEKQNIYQPQASTIVDNAKRLFNKIPNVYNDKTSNVGLIVGKVQSGKTSVMIASAAMAFENGHNVVIAILSDTELLLNQNYERFKETFSNIPNIPIQVFQVSKDGNFTSLQKEELIYLRQNNQKILICVLKHKVRIKSVTKQLEGTGYLDDCVLVFDDEGDDVSQNTVGEKEKFDFSEDGVFREAKFSATNKEIKEFKEKFKRASYVSVTATPESIILLQNIQHLSPDFVLATPPGDGYCGLSYFHYEHRDELITIIDDKPDDINQQNGISKEMKKALARFFAGCYVRSYNVTSIDFKHSMMVHSSRLVSDHGLVTKKIEQFKNDIYSHCQYKRNSATKFIKLVNDQIKEINSKLPELDYDGLRTILERTRVTCMNGLSDIKNIKQIQKILPYHIFVGGDLLDRGVTIDGLAVVYILRESKIGQMDTLLQRARWFGYKSKYIHTCQVYMTENLDKQFREMVSIDDAIWEMLNICSAESISPKDYDFELEMNTKILKPTSKNKASYENVLIGLRSAQKYVMLNPTYEKQNSDLIEVFEICHSSELKGIKYGHQTHKCASLTIKCLVDLLKEYHFPHEETSMSYDNFANLISYLKYNDDDKADVLFIERPDGLETRSTINETNEISGLLQGHSSNKTPDDPLYYPGDRYIVSDRPMLQIHRVKLKNDIKSSHNGLVKISRGTVVIMLAWLFPTKDYSKLVIKKKMLPN